METAVKPRVIQLAEQLRADIEGRGLHSGEPYLGTADAAKMLGVSTTLANRAMQLLVQRNVLTRRQKRGTFVASGIHAGSERSIDRVHLVVNKACLATEGRLMDGVIVGIQGVLPHAEIEFNHLPDSEDADLVSDLIATTARSRYADGFVLIRSSLTSQRLFQASGLPTVIFGSRFPSIQSLPSIDRDHLEAGKLLVTALIQQGVKKIGVLMRNRVLPGDHSFLDSIWKTAAEHHLTPNDLTVRFLPPDEQAIQHATSDLIHLHGATGLICRSQPLVEAASRMLKTLEQPEANKTTIVVSDVYGRSQTRLPWASIRTIDSPDSIGALLAKVLVEQSQGDAPQIPVRRLPVEMIAPIA